MTFLGIATKNDIEDLSRALNDVYNSMWDLHKNHTEHIIELTNLVRELQEQKKPIRRVKKHGGK